MMFEKEDNWDISVCGLNCAKCNVYLAGHGDEEALKTMLGFLKDLKPESIVCDGCRGSLDKHWSSNCHFLACSKKKDLRYCFECREFPCGKLQAFASDGVPHHKKTVENMKRMKEIRIETWLKEQKKKGKRFLSIAADKILNPKSQTQKCQEANYKYKIYWMD